MEEDPKIEKEAKMYKSTQNVSSNEGIKIEKTPKPEVPA
jgi:hypothetical protein